MKRAAALAVLALAAAGAASAEEPAICYGLVPLNSPTFVEPTLKFVAPHAPKKVRFVKNGYEQKGCPEPAERCENPAYVTPGDALIVGGATGGYLCATYVGRKPATAMTTGWLPADSLADPKEPAALRLADWIGEWRSGGEKRISVKRVRERLKIEGEATWGAGDPQRVASGAIHVGSFEATIAPAGASMAFSPGPDGGALPLDASEGICKVRLWRLGPYLVAADNGACGGANVTFSDVYRRD